MLKAISAALCAAITLVPTAAVAAPLPVSSTPTSITVKEKAKHTECKDPLVRTIKRAGFKGRNVREAYAIAMRESNGIASTVSGDDYGLYQFNAGSWSGRLDWSQILDPDYNARAAYKVSGGGKSWIPWGMRDHREWDNASYAGIWSDDQFYAWVIEPYERYYSQFPKKCR